MCAPVVDVDVDDEFPSLTERYIGWEEIGGWDQMLVRCIKIVGVPVVVNEYGCSEVADEFRYSAPFVGAWCASEGKSEHDQCNL